MDVFEACRNVNTLLSAGHESAARDELIQVLAAVEVDGDAGYATLINRLARAVGLYPYIDEPTALWEERYVYEAFKADVGDADPVTLHLQQRVLLERLLRGENIAVSAPTSFGKSFVIDAFIAIQRPTNVVILVPTIALADESRRRLHRKFGDRYKIITTAEQQLGPANILILPQERSIGYMGRLQNVDILIVDEFYKASKAFDKERAPSLVRSIVEFGRIAKQRYYLAPNISRLVKTDLTVGLAFVKLDFNTVFLEKAELYREIGRDEARKSATLLRILVEYDGKSLIYAGTYSNIDRVASLLIDALDTTDSALLGQFEKWLARNYEVNWKLTHLVAKGVGIHNGQLHRSLSQLQVRLFEEEDGLRQLISTSSIIEGVNTSAKNVILWSNKNGAARLNDFTYKNIVGRGGRMFKHFVGRIFILEAPPAEGETQLNLEYPDELLGVVASGDAIISYTAEQTEKIRAFEEQMSQFVGKDGLRYLQSGGVLQSGDADLIVSIARDIRINQSAWNGLRFLNSDNVNSWDRLLYQIIRLKPAAWETSWSRYVAFVKVLSKNWERTIPELLDDLSVYDVGIEDFFKLERNTTFKLAALVGDVQSIFNRIHENNPVDLSLAISRFSCAFLPRAVYQLEEYGLPRMLSRKICRAGVVDLESIGDVDEAIAAFRALGFDKVVSRVAGFDLFDKYILRFFFEGIDTPEWRNRGILE